MLDDIIKRMKTSISAVSDRDMATKLNISPQSVSTWKARNSTPYAICERISQDVGVSIDWLLTGEGNMYRDGRDAVPTQTDDLVQIPEYDVQLAAGSGSYPDDHVLAIKSRAFGKQWLLNKGLQTDKLVLTRVMGDSMEPLIKDKDLVLIDRSRTVPSDAMPFAIRLESALYIKMVQRLSGMLRLVSLNSLYKDIEVNLSKAGDDVEIIGGVVWHAHSWV